MDEGLLFMEEVEVLEATAKSMMKSRLKFSGNSQEDLTDNSNIYDWMKNNFSYDNMNGTQESLESYTKKARLYQSSSTPNASTYSSTSKMVQEELSASEYLNQLLQDKTTVSKMPKIFLHSERLLDEEINRVRNDIFCPSSFLMSLPKPQGNVVKLTEKVYAPVKEHPKFNFVGRIIGPRGLTLRQVEQETGCKLLVRGRGSMKDKKIEDEKRGTPNYEHLEDDLHVLIMVEDTEERARKKLKKAIEEVTFLLQPPKDGEDEIKKKQLQDLAILNGTYRAPNPPTNEIQTNTYQNGAISPNGLLNYPNQGTPIMTQNSASFPGVRNNTVSTALQYQTENFSLQRNPQSFLEYANLDAISILASGKR